MGVHMSSLAKGTILLLAQCVMWLEAIFISHIYLILENEQQQQQGLTLDILEMSNLHPRGEDPTTPTLSLPTGPEI